MFKKIALTIFATVMLVSLSGCRNDPIPETQPASAGSEAQENQGKTITETIPADDQQLLPIISGKAADLQLGAEADGTAQQLKIGDVMEIKLESNPSTGYAWYATSSNPEVIAQQGEAQYLEPESSSSEPMLGAAGSESLFFEAITAGTATLTLEYKRGWETDVAPEKIISITVEVQ